MYHSDSMMDRMWLTDSTSRHPWGSSTISLLRSYTWDDAQPESGGGSPWECWPIPVAHRSALAGGTGWKVLSALEESMLRCCNCKILAPALSHHSQSCTELCRPSLPRPAPSTLSFIVSSPSKLLALPVLSWHLFVGESKLRFPSPESSWYGPSKKEKQTNI